MIGSSTLDSFLGTTLTSPFQKPDLSLPLKNTSPEGANQIRQHSSSPRSSQSDSAVQSNHPVKKVGGGEAAETGFPEANALHRGTRSSLKPQ